jgi:hypothetical protein
MEMEYGEVGGSFFFLTAGAYISHIHASFMVNG